MNFAYMLLITLVFFCAIDGFAFAALYTLGPDLDVVFDPAHDCGYTAGCAYIGSHGYTRVPSALVLFHEHLHVLGHDEDSALIPTVLMGAFEIAASAYYMSRGINGI